MALPKITRMSKGVERARARFLEERRKSALTQHGGQRTLADTMMTLHAMDVEHKYFLKEAARLSRVSDRLNKSRNSEEIKALRERVKKALKKLAKDDSINRGVAKSIRQALEPSPWE